MTARYIVREIQGHFAIWDSTKSEYLLMSGWTDGWTQPVKLFSTEGEAHAEAARLLDREAAEVLHA